MVMSETDGVARGCTGFKADGFGGHVNTAQAIRAEIESLADAASQEILVKIDQIMAAESEIRLWACRDGNGFGRFVLNTSTSSDRRQQSPSSARIRQLAAEVKAKILARSSSIDSAARKVTVTIRPQGERIDIGISVDYR